MNGKSILELMMLAAGQGSSIEVIAEAPTPQAAVDAIAAARRANRFQRGRDSALTAGHIRL